MGAIVNNISVISKDNKTPITFKVHYRDNGYSDSLLKTVDTKTDAIKWLNLWYGDLSGGYEHLEQAKNIVNSLKEK